MVTFYHPQQLQVLPIPSLLYSCQTSFKLFHNATESTAEIRPITARRGRKAPLPSRGEIEQRMLRLITNLEIIISRWIEREGGRQDDEL